MGSWGGKLTFIGDLFCVSHVSSHTALCWGVGGAGRGPGALAGKSVSSPASLPAQEAAAILCFIQSPDSKRKGTGLSGKVWKTTLVIRYWYFTGHLRSGQSGANIPIGGMKMVGNLERGVAAEATQW